MRSFASFVAVMALLVFCMAAEAVEYPQRWVMASADVSTQAGLDKALKNLEIYKADGITHVLLGEAWTQRLEAAPAAYFENAKKYQEEAKRANIQVVMSLYAIGYGGFTYRHGADLAAGIPAKEMPFIVKGKEASADPASGLDIKNSDFEQAAGGKFLGWTTAAPAAENLVVDTTVKHSGNSSAKFSATKGKTIAARLSQNLTVKPFQYYRVTVWVKSEGLEADGESYVLGMGSGGKRRNITTNMQIKPTQEWTRYRICFNTLDSTDLQFSVGASDIAAGTVWFDDLKVEPAGLMLVLRRDMLPLVVTNEDRSITYEEGKDFQNVAGLSDSEFSVDHDPAKIMLTDNSRIKDGQKLLVSFYHPIRIYGEQDVVSIQEPKVLEIMEDQATRTVKAWPVGSYFLGGYDEIRVGGWEPQPNGEKLTPGQLLAQHFQKALSFIRKSAPDAKVYTWSDMFTPYHNASPDGPYYLVNGNWAGSWEGLPKDVAIVNWYAPSKESVKFFGDRGHAQILSGYYDDRGEAGMKKNIENWMKMSEGVPNIQGFMYTTWSNYYQDMPGFFRLIAEYPKWATGAAEAGKDH